MDNEERQSGGILLILLGTVLVAWQWFEIASGHGATFVGWGFPIPIAIPGAWLVFSGLRLLILPRGVTMENVNVVAATATVIGVVSFLGIISFGASSSTRLGLATGTVIGVTLGTLVSFQGSEIREKRMNSFLGSLILVAVPLGLIGASIGSVHNLMNTPEEVRKAGATAVLCVVTFVVSLPSLAILVIVLRSSLTDRSRKAALKRSRTG